MIDTQLIKLGLTKNEVINAVGTPIKLTKDQQFEILWFESKAPSLSTFLFLKNDQIVLTSQAVNEKNTLQTYLDKYGSPVHSVAKFKNFAKDSHQTVLHIWPDKGVSAISYGYQSTSPVVREEHFESQALYDYLVAFGKPYEGNEVVKVEIETVQTTTTASPSPSYSPQLNQFFNQNKLQILIIGVLLMILFAVWLRYLITRRRKPSQP